jgi:hypothetical protein
MERMLEAFFARYLLTTVIALGELPAAKKIPGTRASAPVLGSSLNPDTELSLGLATYTKLPACATAIAPGPFRVGAAAQGASAPEAASNE